MTTPFERAVRIPLDDGRALDGDLLCPESPTGVVAFAHGSGSSRSSPRNRFVARRLHDAGVATLLADLLTSEEERTDRVTAELRFDIGLLAERLDTIVSWIGHQRDLRSLDVGLFGASTGAAAALVAAARRPDVVAAVVSRGGRPDLAGDALADVRAPVLLIVGSRDEQVLELNRAAAARLTCSWQLEVVHGATHLFEEPGTLDEVARRAAGWFREHLHAAARPARRG